MGKHYIYTVSSMFRLNICSWCMKAIDYPVAIKDI